MRVNKFYMTLCAVAVAALVGCGNGGASSSGSNNPVVPNAAITIDNAGTVPVLGNLQTQSVIYVHNNSTVNIANITFSAQANTPESGMVQSNNLIDASACSSIPAGQSCAITFTSPVISGTASQSSMVISANYQINSKDYAISNILNFAKANRSESGVIIYMGVQLSGFGNTNAYGTVYAYGGGTGQVYNVTALSNSNAGISISQGNVAGRQIASNQVQAIELTGQVPQSASANSSAKKVLAGIVSTLSLSSAVESVPAVTYTSTANVGVAPVASGSSLGGGSIPLLNSATTTLGSLLIVNSGTEAASLGSVTFPDNISSASGSNACGSTLAAGASCSLYFNVAANTGGSGTISLPYSSTSVAAATLSQNVTWYDGGSIVPLLMISSNANPLTFNASVGTNNKITVTNIGSYAFKSIKATKPVVFNGSATAIIANEISCKDVSGNPTGDKLPIGGSCSYTLRVNDSTAENGDINYGIFGYCTTAGQGGQSQEVSYERSNIFSYTSNAYTASLSISPNPVIIGTAGGESTTQLVTVINTGAAVATIKKVYFGGGQYEYLTIESSTCDGALAVNNSCAITLHIGSPSNQSTAIDSTENLHIKYSGGQADDTIVTTAINYSILPNNEGLAASVAATGSESGTGTQANPFIFQGYAANEQSVVLSISNQGTDPVQLIKITNNANSDWWSIDYPNSSCYAGGKLPSAAIAVGGSCAIVYKSALTVQVANGSAAASMLPIALPSVIFLDTVTGNQFGQNNLPLSGVYGAVIYNAFYSASITNTISQLGDTLTVTSQLTNAANYAPITVTASMESYFSGIPVPGSNCSVAAVNGNVTQKCVLTPSGGTALASVSYTLNQKGYNKNTLYVSFDEDTSGQAISVYPQLLSLLLQNSRHWTPLGSGFVVAAANSSQLAFDNAGNLYSALADAYYNQGVWKWNGLIWSLVGDNILAGKLNSLGIDHAGNIFTGGITESGNAAIWEFNGSTWNQVGNSDIVTNAIVSSIAFDSNNNLYAGISGNENGVWRWNGESWNEVTGAAIPYGAKVSVVAFDNNGVLYVGGSSSSYSNVGYYALWKLTGNSWSNLATGESQLGQIQSIVFDSSNNLYAGGYVYAGEWPNGALWKLSGNNLKILGSTSFLAEFDSIALGAKGDIYAGGSCVLKNLLLGCTVKWNGSTYDVFDEDYFITNLVSNIPAIAIRNGVLYANGNGPLGSLWAYPNP